MFFYSKCNAINYHGAMATPFFAFRKSHFRNKIKGKLACLNSLCLCSCNFMHVTVTTLLGS